jgi:hypothetical protein
MSRLLFISIVVSGVLFPGAQAFAADSLNSQTRSKRQMSALIVGCMKKRMSADRFISYNEAAAQCKYRVNKEGDDTTPGTLVAADTPAKR